MFAPVRLPRSILRQQHGSYSDRHRLIGVFVDVVIFGLSRLHELSPSIYHRFP